MRDVYIAPGVRTPFVKAGGAYASCDALALSAPVARAMTGRATPDFLVWGQVIPSPTVSNLARELVFEADLDPEITAFSTVLACATSFMTAVEAGAMIGRGGAELALAGGVETMSHVSIGLKPDEADRLVEQFASDPAGAGVALGQLDASAFDLPRRAWANRASGRSQGDHTEDTAKAFRLTRQDQDQLALDSHQKAVAAQDSCFYDDLVVPFAGVARDTLPRRDTSLEKLSRLPPAFDTTSGQGTLTAGNSSPVTDGAAGLWVGSLDGMRRLQAEAAMRLVDWQLAALNYRLDERMLMAPARAIPRLLERHDLDFRDIALWEIHEAFAAQVLANIQAISDPDYRLRRARVERDLGAFPWERLNPNGGSLALGHPFGATGARILSQTAKELAGLPAGSRAVVSICADGGQGAVALLQRD